MPPSVWSRTRVRAMEDASCRYIYFLYVECACLGAQIPLFIPWFTLGLRCEESVLRGSHIKSAMPQGRV